MARYKGINIPEVISPDMGGNNDFMEFVSSFGSSMMRSWIYGMQKKETDMLKSDVTLWGSAVNAATEYKEPEPVQLLLDDLNAEKELYKDDPIRYNYLESVTNKVGARLFNLNKQDDLRNLIEDTEVKLRPLEKGDAAGYKGEALKILDEFQDALFQDEQYQTTLMKQKANEINDEVLYTINGIDLMNAVDDNIEVEGIQINPENYPNESSLVKTREAIRLIEEARDMQSITGKFDKNKYQAANKLYKESLTDRKIGNASQDKVAKELKKDQVRRIKKGAKGLEKAFSLSKGESLSDRYGDFIEDLNINTNIEGIIDVGENAYSKERGIQSRNSVLHDVARIIGKSTDLPENLKKAINEWENDNYMLTSPYLDDIWNEVSYWKPGAPNDKNTIKNIDFPGLLSNNTKVQNLVMQYMGFLKEMDEVHSLMFPEESEEQKRIQNNTITNSSSGSYGGALDQF